MLTVFGGVSCLASSDETPESPGLLLAGQLSLDGYEVMTRGVTGKLLVPEPGLPWRHEDALSEPDFTWSRPDGTCLELDAARFPYDGYLLLNNLNQQVTVYFTAESDTMSETPLENPMLFLYEGSEVPDDPLSCVAADDNSYGWFNARIIAVLEPRTAYYVVVTTFADDTTDTAYGSYIFTIIRG